MGLDAGHLIVEGGNHSRHRNIMESFLEFSWHVIGELPDAVKGRVSNLRVLVSQVLKNDWDHSSDLLDVINIFANLRKSHDTSVLVAPVRVICNGVLDKSSDQGQHVGIADTCDESVDRCFSEVDIVFLFVFASKAFLGAHPVGIDILIDVNHQLEDLLKDVLDQGFVFLCKSGLPFDDRDNELHRLMPDRVICEVFVSDNGLKRLVKSLEVSSKEVWLYFSKLIEFDHGVL